jgi:lipoate---protein ligase
MSGSAWRIERISGTPAELFHGPMASAQLVSAHIDQPLVRIITVDSPVLVLGSGQASAVVGSVPAFVRRRSGGGAVWLDPAEQMWIDVVLPMWHPCWVGDVTESFDWLGNVWVQTLRALDVYIPLAVHKGPLVQTDWSSLLCFAGRGPGEVFAGDRKLIGLSQRRGRGGSLFQCGVLMKWTFNAHWFAESSWPVEPDETVRQAGIGLNEICLPALAPGLIEAEFVRVLGELTQ